MNQNASEMPWYVGAAIAFTAVALLAAALLLSYYVDDEKNRLIIIGAIITNATTVVNWLFGSSKGSQQKDATISAFGEALANSTPPAPVAIVTPAPATVSVEPKGETNVNPS